VLLAVIDDPVAYWSNVLDVVYQDLETQGILVEADPWRRQSL
jgi:hypothetical protein